MCGRYTVTKKITEIEERFEAEFIPSPVLEKLPLFNSGPSLDLPVIVNGFPHVIGFGNWGLVPSFATLENPIKPLINARLESILDRPAFSQAVAKRRCLVISDGYYEWKKVGKRSIPYYVKINQGELFAFAGIYETWAKEGKKGITFSMITQEPNEKLSFIHHRMPAILLPEQERSWLDPKVNASEAISMIIKYPEAALSFYPVSDVINKSYDNNPAFIERTSYNLPTQESAF